MLLLLLLCLYHPYTINNKAASESNNHCITPLRGERVEEGGVSERNDALLQL